jgi:hypothetical protein
MAGNAQKGWYTDNRTKFRWIDTPAGKAAAEAAAKAQRGGR